MLQIYLIQRSRVNRWLIRQMSRSRVLAWALWPVLYLNMMRGAIYFYLIFKVAQVQDAAKRAWKRAWAR